VLVEILVHCCGSIEGDGASTFSEDVRGMHRVMLVELLDTGEKIIGRRATFNER